jgi:hypothetical protein
LGSFAFIVVLTDMYHQDANSEGNNSLSGAYFETIVCSEF